MVFKLDFSLRNCRNIAREIGLHNLIHSTIYYYVTKFGKDTSGSVEPIRLTFQFWNPLKNWGQWDLNLACKWGQLSGWGNMGPRGCELLMKTNYGPAIVQNAQI